MISFLEAVRDALIVYYFSVQGRICTKDGAWKLGIYRIGTTGRRLCLRRVILEFA
jgi:hypothetical protein